MWTTHVHRSNWPGISVVRRGQNRTENQYGKTLDHEMSWTISYTYTIIKRTHKRNSRGKKKPGNEFQKTNWLRSGLLV
jgi:hypothetical protein